MSSWNEITSLALLGTEQRTVPAISGEGAAASALLAKLHSAGERSPESLLLNTAAILWLHRQAAQMPRIASDALTEAAKTDSRPAVSITSAQIKTLIDDYAQTLLPLWLAKVEQAEKRIPERFTSTLLEHAVNNKTIRPALAATIGNRGRWLARQHPEWKFAESEEIALDSKSTSCADTRERLKAGFETATSEERSAAVRELREIDPNFARELVASTWSEDPYQLKVSFLSALDIGLSMNDEPFLEETALNDRRKEVRKATSDLLARLTESRYAKRMLARVLPLLSLKGLLKKSLDVSFPQECDKSMVQDGIEAKSAIDPTGEKQWWLQQMLSVVAPSAWEKHLSMHPEQLLCAIDLGEPYALVVARGWSAAAVLHRDADWAEAFIKKNMTEALPLMAAVLEPQAKERIALEVIRANNGNLFFPRSGVSQPVLDILVSCNHEWSEPFARQIVQMLSTQLPSKDPTLDWLGKKIIDGTGLYVPASLFEFVEKTLPYDKAEWKDFREAIGSCLNTIKFKNDIFCQLAK